MKKFNFFSLAFAWLMLGACSNDNLGIIDNGGTGEVLPGEKGYISLAINMPTQNNSVRANDVFDDGLPGEYKVNDATLLLFNGNSESDAVFAGAYNLTNLSPVSIGGNITASYNITQEITKPGSGNVYALVILNKGTVLTQDEGIWKLKGEDLSSKNFRYFYETVQDIDVTELASITDDNTGNFFMTNAPLYTKPGGTLSPANGNTMTLTQINPENIYSTKNEAENNPAANIYVERAVAKVTVTNSKSSTSALTYEVKGWTLDITNKKSYIVRNANSSDWWVYKANGSNDYRFVGSSAVAAGLYRTYWAQDPNYSSLSEDNFNYIDGTIQETSLNSVGGNAYCLENTFDVSNMNQNQSTRVIVAAKITVNEAETDGDFYVLNNDKSTLYQSLGVDNAVKAEYLANSKVIGALTAPGILVSGPITGDDIEITYDAKSSTGGNMLITEIKIKDESAVKFENGQIPDILKEDNNNEIISDVNNNLKISYYKGGIAYYPVIIRHFDDTQTPWNNEEYNNNSNNFLGRYGVVRNNWYNIDITSIKTIGSPEVPEVYGTPDDPMESWISVKINVLSWAKRNQSVDL